VSYDLLVFEPNDAPRERKTFLKWYRSQIQWYEGQFYDDPMEAAAPLFAWYSDMCRDFPDMNGPDACDLLDDDNPRATGYTIGQSVIYADFRWSESEAAYTTVRTLAARHHLGFFDVSDGDGEIWFPPEPTDEQTCPSFLRPWWQFWR